MQLRLFGAEHQDIASIAIGHSLQQFIDLSHHLLLFAPIPKQWVVACVASQSQTVAIQIVLHDLLLRSKATMFDKEVDPLQERRMASVGRGLGHAIESILKIVHRSG